MFKTFEQVAIRTENVEQAVTILRERTGYADWVRDRVDAVHLYGHPSFNLGESFQVELAFNYELIDGVELELIELRNGKTVQLLGAPHHRAEDVPGPAFHAMPLSHLGYHIGNDSDERASELRLTTALRYWIDRQCPIAQLSQTMLHSGTRQRYRYAFADARPLLGNWVKIIQRLPKASTEESIIRGREAFAWLHEQI